MMMMIDLKPIIIPVYTVSTGEWTTREFDSKDDFKLYVRSKVRKVGQYNLHDTKHWKPEAIRFDKNKRYVDAIKNSKDYKDYWRLQKKRCKRGIIVVTETDDFFISRFYYFYLNFIKILDKIKADLAFPMILDTDYDFFLYIELCELEGKHALVLKKRQIGFSLKICAMLVYNIWFKKTSVNKIGAFDKTYVEDSWNIIKEYRNFLNENTGWYRSFDPDKDSTFYWKQEIELTTGTRKTKIGMKSILRGLTFEKSPTKGVGGKNDLFFYEEAGVSPTMDITCQYMFPALGIGKYVTGLLIASGAVGQLDKCAPLKNYFYSPDPYFLPVDNIWDEDRAGSVCGYFVPEYYSLMGFFDEDGNSDIEAAKAYCLEDRELQKKHSSAEEYKLYCSQRPFSPGEAFAFREDSKFPTHLIQHQLDKITIDKEYPCEYLNLRRNPEGKIVDTKSDRLPIVDFPVPKNLQDKRACLTVWERPAAKLEWGDYYASIDPVGEGKTSSSDSLCSIMIMKNSKQVTTIKHDSRENHVEPEKIVASWCGRFDDINETHQFLEMIIEWYNAWTLVENNISHFILYMISIRKQHFLVPKSQIIFLKELNANSSVYQEYGWKNVGTMFRIHLLSYAVEYCKEVIDQEVTVDGEVVSTIFGVERIPDPMLLREMMAYQDNLNVDRLVSFAALVAFVTIQRSNRGINTVVEYDTERDLQNSKNLYKLKVSPFTHLGTKTSSTMTVRKNAFKNIR